jgi:cell wall-associated NlpC family hydrolase
MSQIFILPDSLSPLWNQICVNRWDYSHFVKQQTGLDWTGLDWTGTRSPNVAKWQGNLVESARGWTGLDWTGLDWTGLDWTGLDWTGLEPGLPMWQNGSKTSLKAPGDGLDWTGLDWTETRSHNVAEWQQNLVERARGWTGLDWTGLDWNPVSQCGRMAAKPR